MYAMKVLIFCTLICLTFTWTVKADDLQNELAAREECSEFSQAGMHDCLAKKVAASELALKKAETKVYNGFTAWGEDAKYITIAKSKFETSKKAFVRYRKAHCEFNASLGGGAIGSALALRRLACLFELNLRRAEQLNSVITTLPTK